MRSRARGFTLAEVLVAVAVIGLAAVGSLHAITAAMRTVRASRAAEELALRAEALAGQWRVDGYPAGERDEGDFEDRRDIRWRVEFRPARIPGVETPGLEEARLDLSDSLAQRSYVFYARRRS